MKTALNILSSLFPARCILCQKTVDGGGTESIGKDIDICFSCVSTPPVNDACCLSCALPLAEDIGKAALCGRCIKKQPDFDYSYSLFRYEDDLIKLIHQLKFSEKISHARSIGEMMLAKLQAEMPCPEDLPGCLLPVPLHSSRMRQRGFNQSIEIARVIAKRLQIPIAYDEVVRQRSTGSQTGLTAKQRQSNIRGAFKLVKKLEHKHVLIIDDVVTTGSTVNELAKLLKMHKVEKVGVLSIARAPIKS